MYGDVEFVRLVVDRLSCGAPPAVVEWQLLQRGEYVVCMLGCWQPIIFVLFGALCCCRLQCQASQAHEEPDIHSYRHTHTQADGYD